MLKILKVQVHGELAEGEMRDLILEWRQHPINTEDGELYVRRWHSGSDFFIIPEQELEGEQIQGVGMQMGGM